MKKIIIVGLGKFGGRVAEELATRRGVQTYAVDQDEHLVEKFADRVHTAATGNVDDPEVLNALLAEMGGADAAVVSLGGASHTSTLVALRLREAGVQRIVVKADDPSHGEVLRALDAGLPGDCRFQVIIPELDAASQVARQISSDFVERDLPLDADFGFMEVRCPPSMAGKSLQELEVRKRFDVNVVGFRRAGGPVQLAGADTVLKEDDLITVVGSRSDLQALEKKFGKA